MKKGVDEMKRGFVRLASVLRHRTHGVVLIELGLSLFFIGLFVISMSFVSLRILEQQRFVSWVHNQNQILWTFVAHQAVVDSVDLERVLIESLDVYPGIRAMGLRYWIVEWDEDLLEHRVVQSAILGSSVLSDHLSEPVVVEPRVVFGSQEWDLSESNRMVFYALGLDPVSDAIRSPFRDQGVFLLPRPVGP